MKRPPRLGFAGTGWIGQQRLRALRDAEAAEIAAVADPSETARADVGALAPEARLFEDFQSLLEVEDLDGVVIASPSALHADQATRALARGLPVFCQKPLGRSLGEVAAVVRTAERADRLLGVDLSYRRTRALCAVREVVQSGQIGRVYACRLTFDNAYGPDKPWFRQRTLSGGGCVMDLGIHLVDAVLWILRNPTIRRVDSQLFADGQALGPGDDRVEDYASVLLRLDRDVLAEIRCSWWLSAGQDAVIHVEFHGTKGSARLRNVDGSFYDLVAERCIGTQCQRLIAPPDDWGGRAILAWARRLVRTPRFSKMWTRGLLEVAQVLDEVYGRHTPPNRVAARNSSAFQRQKLEGLSGSGSQT